VTAGALAALVVLAVALALSAAEPMRRAMERKINERLRGYTVTITRLDFHPLGFSLDLEGVTVTQDSRPEAPVAQIGLISASVQWRALLRGRLVADFGIDRPVVHVDRTNVLGEVDDDTPLRERGWQAAVETIYPLRVNELVIRDGQLTYVDRGDAAPLEITAIQVRAENIRNIRSPERTYPSDVYVQARVFADGRASFEGQADFLAVPHAGARGALTLTDVRLRALAPVLARYHVGVRNGRLSAVGDVEYAPHVKTLALALVTVTGLDAEYSWESSPLAPSDQRMARRAARSVREVANDPEIQIRADHLKVTGTMAFANRVADPPYRLYFSDLALDARDVSNHGARPAAVRAAARFMGSGATTASGTFRGAGAPDFDVKLAIEDTDLTRLNDLLRAYAKVDVTRGLFTFYAEARVQNGAVQGYAKPLFRDVEVYHPGQDAAKHPVRQLYERVVGGVARLLENKTAREEIATRTDFRGPLGGDVKAGTLEAVIGLVQNAFFKAILPGFEGQLGRRPSGNHQGS
jgi:hypothetical protein